MRSCADTFSIPQDDGFIYLVLLGVYISYMVSTSYIALLQPSNPSRQRKLAFREFGDINNPNVVVCVHGLSRNAKDFDRLATALSSRYRVICPDMTGRGDSDWLEDKNGYNYLTYISDIGALLLHLKVSQVDWVGTSMGGIIGMMIAAQQPFLIKRMVINDIGAVVSAEGLKRILSFVGKKTAFDTRAEAMDALKFYLQPFGITLEADWEFMCDISFKQQPDGRYHFNYDPEITKPFKEAAMAANNVVTDIDLSMAWNVVQCPVLVLRGVESDILSAATAQGMLKRVPPTKLVEFPSVGHAPALLSPEQIKVITDWLA